VGSDLETNYSCATRYLAEMLEAQVDPQRANVVVYTGGSQRWHANIPNDRNCVIDIASGHGKVAAATDRSLNMGDAATLASFVRWATENYPAEHTALVLWDHGGGPLKGACYDEKHKFDALTLKELDEAFEKGVRDRRYDPNRRTWEVLPKVLKWGLPCRTMSDFSNVGRRAAPRGTGGPR
jgi:hypothetical protein